MPHDLWSRASLNFDFTMLSATKLIKISVMYVSSHGFTGIFSCLHNIPDWEIRKETGWWRSFKWNMRRFWIWASGWPYNKIFFLQSLHSSWIWRVKDTTILYCLLLSWVSSIFIYLCMLPIVYTAYVFSYPWICYSTYTFWILYLHRLTNKFLFLAGEVF